AGCCYHLPVSPPRVSPGTVALGLPPEDLILNAVRSGTRVRSLLLLQGGGVRVCLPAGSATLDVLAAERVWAGAPAAAGKVPRWKVLRWESGRARGSRRRTSV